MCRAPWEVVCCCSQGAPPPGGARLISCYLNTLQVLNPSITTTAATTTNSPTPTSQIGLSLLATDQWTHEVHVAQDLARLSRLSRRWRHLCQSLLWPELDQRTLQAACAPPPLDACTRAVLSRKPSDELCKSLLLPLGGASEWSHVKDALMMRWVDLGRDALSQLGAELRLKKKGASNADKAKYALAALDPGMAAQLAASDAQVAVDAAAAASTSTSSGGHYVMSPAFMKVFGKKKTALMCKSYCKKNYGASIY